MISPNPISIEKCSEIILKNNVVFVTGAGISKAAGIHTLSSIWKDLGINFDVTIDSYVIEALHNPEQLVMKILDFYRAARDNSPTPAHYSLARMAKFKKCQILSGNFDLLQEKAGVIPYRLFCDHYIKDLDEKDLSEIDGVICIGMSHDIHSFIASYKNARPNGIIISIDQIQPKYVGNDDFFLQGDIQHLLPSIEQSFKKNIIKRRINNEN